MTGAEGIGGGAATYFALRAQSVRSASPASSLTGGEGAGGLSGGEGGGADSVSISGIGQLLGALQQLQTQSPNQFTQVVSQISNQLQTAAQQQGQTSQASALSDLANQFQNVASTGDLSQLHLHRHTQNNPSSTYGSTGQSPASNSSGNSNLQQLFANIANEVNAALGN
jgi:hypothetical protein